MALRDIIARYGIQIDGEEKLAKVKKSLDAASGSFTDLAAAAWLAVEGAEAVASAMGALAGFTLKTTNAASHAEENMAGLKATFEDGSAAVVQWSLDTAKALGRSEYALQEYALRFGAFLQPVFADTGEDVAQMSKVLSELALDLASFYDTTEEEAMMRLFSGMSGETEAVRRLGIDISDASLNAFNAKKGDNRTMQALTLAEKSVLRYQKILQDTLQKQGDVVRSQGRWADSMKRLTALWEKLEIVLGQKIMPTMMGIAEYGTQFLLDVIQLVEKSSFLEASWVTVGVLLTEGAYAAGAMLVSFFGIEAVLGSIVGFLSPLIAITLAFLAIEDVVTFVRGGDSVFGEMLKDATGLEAPLTVVKTLLAGIWQDMQNIGIWMQNKYEFAEGLTGLVLSPFIAPVALAEGKFGEWSDDIGQKVFGEGKAYVNDQQGFTAASMEGLGWFQDENLVNKGRGGGRYDQMVWEKQQQSSRDVANSREDGWTQAIMGDDLLGAVDGFKMEHESRATAWDRANRERAALVTTGAVAPTDWDIQRGFVDPTGASGAIYSAPSNFSGGRGDANMSVSVSVETGADAQTIGNVVAEKVREELRVYSHASQEESYDDGYTDALE